MTIYHMINWFFLFSFLGYLLECLVLSLEYRQPVINRGFGHGPFCIIYGFGAIGAYLILRPFAENPAALFAASMAMATSMEIVTAELMIRLFGAFWWDYSKKPFNYRGIICLESSIGWGILGIVFFHFLDGFAHNMVGMVPEAYEPKLAMGLVLFYLLDFSWCMRVRLNGDDDDDTIGRLKVY